MSIDSLFNQHQNNPNQPRINQLIQELEDVDNEKSPTAPPLSGFVIKKARNGIPILRQLEDLGLANYKGRPVQAHIDEREDLIRSFINRN